MESHERHVRRVREHAQPLRHLRDVQPVLAHLAGAHTVLLGEASHGTHEFYALRAALTKALIDDHGFDAVAVESDWPDALRVNRHVRGDTADADAPSALGGYERFPRWMWRNREVRDFVAALRRRNDALPPRQRAGFYGIDLYSPRASMAAVVAHLERIDPEAARRARQRYACFDHYGADPQRYAHATRFGLAPDCEDAVVRQLQELLAAAPADVPGDPDAAFHAAQDARVVRNAERYYRSLFGGRDESWNLRDTHMAETLHALRVHLEGRLGRAPRLVVWAHNSHIGDARATEPASTASSTSASSCASASSTPAR